MARTAQALALALLFGLTAVGSASRMAENFAKDTKLWTGQAFEYTGSGIKYKTILFVKIQLYAIALYVEEEEAARELKRLQKEGFFKDYSTDSLCRGLLAGSFNKFLQFQLLRDVTYAQFTGEIGRDLKPRLDSTGDPTLWTRFANYFGDKTLSKESALLALVKELAAEGTGKCEGGLFPPGFTDFQHAEPTLKFSEAAFGSSLLDVYLGENGIVSEAKEQWAQSAKNLLGIDDSKSALNAAQEQRIRAESL